MKEIKPLRVVKNVLGKKCSLEHESHVRTKEFRITAYACNPDCVCDGYEVCLHLLHSCGRGPVWPIFNASSPKEALEIQTKLCKFAATISPDARMRSLETVLEAWAICNGWQNVHHIVWRHPSQNKT